jgi:hypothetical protein
VVVVFVAEGPTQIQLADVGHDDMYVRNKMPASMVQRLLGVGGS